MVNSFNSVLSILVMIIIGYFLAWQGLFNKETNKLFSKLVINIALPVLMIVNLPARFTIDKLLNSLNGLFVTLISILLTYICSIILANILKIDDFEKGIFSAMFTFGNSVFLGLPINISLFGEESATYVFLFYLINTTLFWTIGVYNIKKSNKTHNKDYSLSQRIKMILSPPMIGFIIAILFVIFKIRLPEFLISSFRYISSLSTPLSMFFIGTVIYSIKLKDIKLNVSNNMILIGKFIISPLLMFSFLKFFDLPILLKNVFIIEASMPIITQLALVSEFYGADSKQVSIMVGLSTLLSMILIPIYSILFTY